MRLLLINPRFPGKLLELHAGRSTSPARTSARSTRRWAWPRSRRCARRTGRSTHRRRERRADPAGAARPTSSASAAWACSSRGRASCSRYYRSRGHFVVAGGSYASLCPEEYAALADTVVAGEAEYIWKEFCARLRARRARSRCTTRPERSRSPTRRRRASTCSSSSAIPTSRCSSRAAARSAASSATSSSCSAASRASRAWSRSGASWTRCAPQACAASSSSTTT